MADDIRVTTVEHNVEPRFDGALLNILTGMGVPGRDKSVATTVAFKQRRMSKEQKEALFATRILRKICSVFPTEGVRKGWTIKLGGQAKDPKIISAFNDYQAQLQVKKNLSWAKILANAYDGAVVILNIDDGQPPDKPINKKNIRSIKELLVLDRYKLNPDLTLNSDPFNPQHYQLILPMQVMVQFRAEYPDLAADEYRIHRDRILRFDGVELLPDQMLENQGWGMSVIEQIWDVFKLWDSSHQAIASILHNFDVMVYGLKGLSKLIAAGEEDNIKKRLHALQQTNSVYGGIAIDSDAESLNSFSRNVSGLPALVDLFRDRLIGESEVSHTFLFGESPSGLGATGESEEKTDAKKIHAFQEEVFRPQLDTLLELIWLAKDGPTKGKIPDDWSYEFVSLLDEDQQEKIQTRDSQAQTDNTYLSAGVLLPEEVRQSRFGGSEYSFETVLDNKLWKQKQDEQNQQSQAYSNFDPDQQDDGSGQQNDGSDQQFQQDSEDSSKFQIPKYHKDDCGCTQCTLTRQAKKLKKTLQSRSRRKKKLSRATEQIKTESPESTSVRRKSTLSPKLSTVALRSDSTHDISDLITNKLSLSTNSSINTWLNQIDKACSSASSFSELRDRLPLLYKKIDNKTFAEQLMHSRIIANLAGRLEVLQEAKNDNSSPNKK